MNKNADLLNKLNEQIVALRNKMIKKFGFPPETKGMNPTKEQLFDFYVFYNENKSQIKNTNSNVNNEVNIQFLLYIDERIKHTTDAAKYHFGLNFKRFHKELRQYLNTVGLTSPEKN